MSVERALPPARQATRHPLARLTAAGCAVAIALSAGCRGGPDDYLVKSSTAPDTHHVALVRLVRCETDWCERLAIGPTADGAQPIAALAAKERCSEIVWSPDGKRVGFVINGQQLRLYEADGHRPAGQIDLVPRDSDPPTREARGITFSGNGAAITFDDCPRQKSGCLPRILALR
jgi:hypothetical protein